MYFIVGIDHHLQNGCCDLYYKKADRIKFQEFLRAQIISNEIKVVAEESSIEAKNDYCNGTNNTLPELISAELKIDHVFCDLNRTEREALGLKFRDDVAASLNVNKLPDGKYSDLDQGKINEAMLVYDEKRIKEWLKKITAHERNVLLICGYAHTDMVRKILLLSHVQSKKLIEIKACSDMPDRGGSAPPFPDA